jgi:WD40 repeat protein
MLQPFGKPAMLENSSLQNALLSNLTVVDELQTDSAVWLDRDLTPFTDALTYGDPDANWVLQNLETPLRHPKSSEKSETPLRLLQTLNFGYSVRHVVLHPDGDTIATVGSPASRVVEETNTIQIWNWRTGEQLRLLSGHTAPITAIALSANGQYLVSGSCDRTVKVWNFATGQEVITLHDHLSPVTAVAISADGQTVISAGCNQYESVGGQTRITVRDRALRIWNVKRGKPLHLIPCLTDAPEMIIGKGDLFLKLEQQPEVFSLQTGEQITLQAWLHPVVSNQHQKAIFTTSEVSQSINFKVAESSGVAPSSYRSQVLALSPNGQRFVSGFRRTRLSDKHHNYLAGENVLRIWNPTTGQLLSSVEVGQGLWQDLQFSVDGQLLATSVGQTLQVWQVR